MLSIILTLASGVWKAIMDLSSEDHFTDPWWNKNQSWQNKDKYKPKWLWRNFLVAFTDGWHLSQMLFLLLLMSSCIVMAIGSVKWWYPVVIFGLMRVGFWPVYKVSKAKFSRRWKLVILTISSILVLSILVSTIPVLNAHFRPGKSFNNGSSTAGNKPMFYSGWGCKTSGW